MAVIVKVGPGELPGEGEGHTSLKGYRGCRPRPGDRAFVWVMETGASGGIGLSSRATVVSSGQAGGVVELRLLVDPVPPARPLGNAQLDPHRDCPPAEPIARLAHKLYRHSHRKVADLDAAEVEFLDRHF